MPSNKQVFRHVFGGGWATDFGEVAEVGIGQDGLISIPFMTENKNNFFELDGGVHKIGGTVRMNAAQAAGGAEVIGLVDYWKGAGGTPSRKIVMHAGTAVYAADLDGNFSDISSGEGALQDDVVPSYETFDDLLIIASDTASDVPFSYDQTTFQVLNAGAPNFAFSETHKNRLWAAGNKAAPSKLYYSAYVDPEDWSGEGSGSIDIDPNDGDSITGLASHKNDLWVFKGPYRGSIHRIVGSAPTGGDSFGRQTFVRGLGAVWHNTIFRFRDDLGFMWSDGSIHSLNATAAFGDFNETAISRPINGWLRTHVNGNRLKYAWAATDSVRGYVLFTLAVDTVQTNNHHLLMDYRFSPPRWAHWDSFTSGCLATVIDSGVPILFDGSNDGYVRRLQRSARNIDGTGPIVSRVDFPFLNYGDPGMMKQLERAAVGISPKGVYNLTFGWTRDNNAEQTFTQSQGGIGFLLGTDKLDTGVLGGSFFRDRFMSLEEGGEFRSISYSVRNGSVDQDLELHTLSTKFGPGAESWEN
jgi:hypothetical protein